MGAPQGAPLMGALKGGPLMGALKGGPLMGAPQEVSQIVLNTPKARKLPQTPQEDLQ